MCSSDLIPQAGIGRRRIWEPETLPKDIRLINSHYDDLYRIPDGGVIQVDYPDGRSFTARLEHLDLQLLQIEDHRCELRRQ